jgi:hypothetical protein
MMQTQAWRIGHSSHSAVVGPRGGRATRPCGRLNWPMCFLAVVMVVFQGTGINLATLQRCVMKVALHRLGLWVGGQGWGTSVLPHSACAAPLVRASVRDYVSEVGGGSIGNAH